jgi:hypothetical protein
MNDPFPANRAWAEHRTEIDTEGMPLPPGLERLLESTFLAGWQRGAAWAGDIERRPATIRRIGREMLRLQRLIERNMEGGGEDGQDD